MRLIFADAAWEDYRYWQAHDPAVFARINHLISAIRRDPFAGVGKPQALRHALDGFWSRRIDLEQRIVYRVDGDTLAIAQLRVLA